ncbi:hypothetical protein CEXT_577401 [Caerostris extrusa]|uniref:Uncharacterized protein n=1 Tax=Caerostris extrusa TaxID=172846 RepID=A0AAV4RGL5_CAEEX|nr:hypothetical protein CEXT_577401 [Caerostris extrusa]
MQSLETPNSKAQSPQFRFIRLLSFPSTTEPHKHPYSRHSFRNTSIENSWLIPETLFKACRQFLGNDLGGQIWVDSSKEVEFELHRSSVLLGLTTSFLRISFRHFYFTLFLLFLLLLLFFISNLDLRNGCSQNKPLWELDKMKK